MSLKNAYLSKVFQTTKEKYPNESEFLQAVEEVLLSFEPVVEKRPELEKNAIIERLVEPERIISFKISWVDDNGKVQVNRGYRVQFNSAIGIYKGGLRFHPSVNQSIIKFLGFEQCLKNSLTGLPLGGGKGGSDFDPKGKSDAEVMRFCQSFMTELVKHIGQFTDGPAGDIGVGAREIGYMFGQCKRLQNEFNGTLSGKGLAYGGSLTRKEATGYGVCYFAAEMLNDMGLSFKDKTVVISGSGNVAIYACEKSTQLGAKVIALSDSSGYIYDENGINLDVIKDLKEVKRARISEYANIVKGSKFTKGKGIWSIKSDIAIPCATENEILIDDAKKLIENGCLAVVEGSNMSSDLEAINAFLNSKTVFAPSKAANAGGVAVSGLEMTQNSMRLSWTFEEVDAKLQEIMKNIYHNCSFAAKEYGMEGNLVAGANIFAFEKIADAMIAQGIAY